MTHQEHDDDNLPGLSQALHGVHWLFREHARSEFYLAICGDGLADLEGPDVVHYFASGGIFVKKARLVRLVCPTFTFDIYFIPTHDMEACPVVARAYFSPHYDMVLMAS